MLWGNFFEINEEIRRKGQICPSPVCLGLHITHLNVIRDTKILTVAELSNKIRRFLVYDGSLLVRLHLKLSQLPCRKGKMIKGF